MNTDRSYAAYKNYRIYLPYPDAFRQNAEGDYLVHVEIGWESGGSRISIPIPDCVAKSYQVALQLSVDQAMTLINRGGPELAVLQGQSSQRRPKKESGDAGSGTGPDWGLSRA